MNLKDSPLYAESWNVAVRTVKNGDIITNHEEPFSVIPNAFTFWAADPFLFAYEGRTFLFAELYDYRLCRGTIGYTELAGTDTTGWKQVIVEPFHMSYPMLFQQGHEIYMMPETSEKEELRLYRAVSFPTKWECCRVIKSKVKWVDTTLLDSGDFWLGYTMTLGHEGCRFRMDADFTISQMEVLSHESLPDYRNAGAFIRAESGVLRPCQEFGNEYGTALIIRQYDASGMNERLATRISPGELRFNQPVSLRGMHTYARSGQIEVIDIKTRRLNLLNLVKRCQNRIRKRKDTRK